MEPLTLAALSVGLAMDATAVAAAAGLAITPFRWAPGLRMAFHFGLFQSLMPLLGWLLGETVRTLIAAYDHWFAFVLLALVGGRMLWEAASGDGQPRGPDPSRGVYLLLLSVAVSIDALAVGLSLALLDVPIILPVIVIGLVTGAMSLAGYSMGNLIGSRGGRGLHAAGGIILLAIGLRILLSHITG